METTTNHWDVADRWVIQGNEVIWLIDDIEIGSDPVDDLPQDIMDRVLGR